MEKHKKPSVSKKLEPPIIGASGIPTNRSIVEFIDAEEKRLARAPKKIDMRHKAKHR